MDPEPGLPRRCATRPRHRTQEPGTQEPRTQEPGTQEPGTQEPRTQEPGTSEPGTTRWRILVVALLALLVAASESAAQQEPIRYTLSFPDAMHHYVEVEALYPAAGRPEVTLWMPVWTPGSYLVREYSRNVEALAAASPQGQPLPVEKIAKNRWRIRTGGSAAVTVRYRVFSREMGVRTNWVESRYAHIMGAGTFLTLEGGQGRPHHVALSLPSNWRTSISGMPSGGAPHTFLAASYDILVDSPIVAGDPAVHEFEAAGKPHFLVNVNEPPFWDVARSVEDVRKIVEQYAATFGPLPYDKYVFLNILNEAGGGLEHLNSTTLMASRWATSTRRRYTGWLGLVSHEYFHLWNVKRLRPIELGPFDYESEVYTRSLWVAEGLTDYYGNLMLRRAGLVSDEEYLSALSSDIRALQTTPGRLVQPVEMASFDAWIKEYRPDDNSPNVAISYYTKGAVIGFLLDAKIRRATGGSRTLDDVIRTAYARYSGPKGFTPAEFRAVIREVAGADFGEWLRRALETTEELDYQEALDWFGLQFTAGAPAGGRRGGERSWQGLQLRDAGSRLVVSHVRRGTPGYASGINVDDEIVALGDYRVRADQWDGRIETLRAGDTVSVLVARRDELMRFPIAIADPEPDRWQLRTAAEATPEQRERVRRWRGKD